MIGNFDVLTRAALGAVGGLAGTMVLQAIMAAGQRWCPETLAPLREDPGQFMVERAGSCLPQGPSDGHRGARSKTTRAILPVNGNGDLAS